MDRPASAVLNGSVQSPDVADPVFVLCMGRSGSTLLRFLLDAHPDLAWTYHYPLPAVFQIAGLVAFYNEKVDIAVDGAALRRPQTQFS